MSRQDVLEGVRRVLRDQLSVNRTVELDTDLGRDLQLDSLAQLTLVVELENHFRICFEPGDDAGVASIGDLVQLVHQLVAQRA